MTTFEEIYKKSLLGAKDNRSANILADETPPLYSQINDFLNIAGFHDLELDTKGSKSLVFEDKSNKDFVIRISNDVREVVPQIIQPFYKKKFGSLNLEFVQNLGFDDPETLEAYSSYGGNMGLVAPYKKELDACGYTLFSDFPHRDLGVFKYTDSAGKVKFAPMGVDADMVEREYGDNIPKCTEGYPTLEVQWKEQCKIVEKDERLKKMVGIPERLPTTRVISGPGVNP